MSYLDTCYIVAFIDEKDKKRKDIGKSVNSIKSKNRYYVSMPAIGEAIMVITRKYSDSKEGRKELERVFGVLIDLLVKKCFVIKDSNGINNDGAVFELARNLQRNDPHKKITPMDALITAIAVLDEDCQSLCTMDRTLLMDEIVSNTVISERKKHTTKEFRIQTLY